MPTYPEAYLRRAELVHYQLQSALYIPHRQKLATADFFWSDAVPHPEWNHAGLVAASTGGITDLVAEARSFYGERGRRPTVTVSPFSRPPELSACLADHGFSPSFRHSWLFDPGTAEPAAEPPPADEQIRRVSTAADLRAFIDIFYAVFDVGGAPGYGETFEASWHRSVPGIEIIHLLARRGDAPVGIATAIHGDGPDGGRVAGLYNLGVLPSARRCGLGRRLTTRRIVEARARGCDPIFLQTEESSVEHWQRRAGLVAGFTVEGWSGHL